MNNTNEKRCRLCLVQVCGETHTIGKAAKDTSYQVLLKMHLDEEAPICNKCMERLQLFFNIISCVTPNHTTEEISRNLEGIQNTNRLKSVEQLRCCFCRKTIEMEEPPLLNESKETIFLLDMLRKYFTELDLNKTKGFLSCKACLQSLQCISSLVTNYLNDVTKTTECTKIDEEDIKDQIELDNTQKCLFKPALKREVGCCIVNETGEATDEALGYKIKTEAELKENNSIGNQELDIKMEEINIKLEPNDYENIQESKEVTKAIDERNSFQCQTCLFNTDCEVDIENHVLTHNSSVLAPYKCKRCTYTTIYKSNLTQYVCSKLRSDEIYKCGNCTYEAKHKRYLRRHMSIHKNPLDVKKYKCELCPFESKHKVYFNQHLLTHKNPLEVTTFKCALCPYKTIHKKYFHSHKLIHKDPSEVKMYKCELCTYETKHKNCVKQHMLTHIRPAETKTYNCEKCPFVTKHRSHVRRHMATHLNPLEVTPHKCEMCTYETVQKRYLKQHMLTHEKLPQGTRLKCEMCPYETKYKGMFNRHMLTHKKPAS